MRLRTFDYFLIFIVIIAILSAFAISSCNDSGGSVDNVAKQVLPNTYDNGQNIAWIRVTNITQSFVLLQNWINANPNKTIISFSSDSMDSSGGQFGWMIIYKENK